MGEVEENHAGRVLLPVGGGQGVFELARHCIPVILQNRPHARETSKLLCAYLSDLTNPERDAFLEPFAS